MKKIYVPERKDVKLSHIPLLYPFWGLTTKSTRLFQNGVQKFFEKPFFSLVENPAEADGILLPYEYFDAVKVPQVIEEISALSKRYSKPILIYDSSDYVEKEISFQNALIFRVSAYCSRKAKNVFLMPYLTEDLGANFGFTPRIKGNKAVVGFCGWGDFRTEREKVKAYLRAALTFRLGGVIYRRRVLAALGSSRDIQPNFIIRHSYSAHEHTISLSPQEAREQFVENIQQSDFSLAIRGDANNSIRFYEILSLGRIPALVDTDVALPLETILPYDSFIMRLGSNDNWPLIMAEHFKNMTGEEFVRRQELARQYYVSHLRPDSFFKHIFSSGYFENIL